MMRKSLGRGLDALIDNPLTAAYPADADGGGAALLMVAPAQIRPNPFQPRRHFDPERLAELAAAIRSQGIIEPLIVRPLVSDFADGASGFGPDRYQLIAGERRLRAAVEVGLAVVPVVVRELDDHAALEVSLVENLAREDLHVIEEARAFDRLNREFGRNHEEIAARIGKSRPYVTNAIRLLELPPEILEMVEQGTLSAGQARPLLAMAAAADQLTAAARIARAGVSARGAEEIVQAAGPLKTVGQGARGKQGRVAAADANLAALADSIQRALKRKVTVARRRGKRPGRIGLEYYNDADLTTLGRILVVAGQAFHGDK